MKPQLIVVLCALMLGGCDRFISAESRVQRAQTAADAGDHRTAVVELMNAIKKEPDNANARLLFAESSFWLGDAGGAERELARLKTPVDPARRAELEIRIALAKGQAEEARKRLSDPALPIPAAHRDLHLGTALLQLRQAKEARAHFHAAAAADPKLLVAAAAEFEAQAAEGDVGGALTGLEALTKAHPDSAAAWMSYGMLLASSGETARGADALTRANELAPRQLEVTRQVMLLAALVEARLLESRIDDAKKAAETLTRLVPGSPVAMFVNSRIAMATNDYAGAIAQLRNVVKAAPSLQQARLLLAMALVAQGNLEQASQELNQLIADVPDHATARQLLAQVRMRLDDPDGALRMLVPVLEGGGGDVHANALIDAARSKLGASQSVSLLEKMHAEDPDNRGLEAQLASAYLQAGAPDKAAALLRRGGDQAGGNAAEVRRAAILLRAIEAAEGTPAARAEVRALIAAHPADPYLATLAAAFFAREGDPAAGRDVLNNALARGAEPASLLLPLAQLEWSTGARKNAAASLDRLLALQPKNLVAHMAAGEIALAERDAAGAQRHFQTVLDARPDSIDARLRLAQVALAQNEPAKADELIAGAAKIAPQSADVRNAIGMLYLNSGRADQALEHFRAACAADEKNATSWFNLGRTQRMLGQVGPARESVEHALRVQPGWLPASAVLVMMDIEARNSAAALARVADLRKADPRNVDVLILEGDVYSALQRHAEAAAAYESAYAMRASGATAARDYRTRVAGKLPKPALLLDRWVAANPSDLSARMLVADAAVRAGEKARAAEHYRVALEARPGDVVVLNNLAWLYFEMGDPRAIALARDAVRVAPKVAAVNDTLGWLLVNDGKAAEGLKYLQLAVDTPGADSEIRFHHAAALARNGRGPEAQRSLQVLLREDDQFASRGDAERLLSQLNSGQ